MKLYIELHYKGQRIDCYKKMVYPNIKRPKTITIDITEHVNKRVRDAITRTLKTLTTADKLPRTCRICGCTDKRACPDGCHWVDKDLCSKCIDIAKMKKPA